MRIGILLPTFEVGARHAFEVAAQAAEAGLDGVFAYDHLWPMGSPARPALAPFPVLAAVLARHESLTVGPLVARIGLLPSTTLIESLRTLEALGPGRVVAALGTGDRLSAAENEAYGLGVASASQRREELGHVARVLGPEMPVWVGAGSPATNELARRVGATLNLWNATPEQVAAARAEGPVSWAGPVPAHLELTLDRLESAGATWAVLSPHASVAALGAWRAGR